MTAALVWLVSPLWGTVSWVEAGWLALTAAILLYLKGHLCDARAQARVAADPIERRSASADVWDVVREIWIQTCFGLIGLYGALTPSSPVNPERVLGALAITGLLVAVQVANIVFAYYRRESRRWITDALGRQRRAVHLGAVAGGRRRDDPPGHADRPEVRG